MTNALKLPCSHRLRLLKTSRPTGKQLPLPFPFLPSNPFLYPYRLSSPLLLPSPFLHFHPFFYLLGFYAAKKSVESLSSQRTLVESGRQVTWCIFGLNAYDESKILEQFTK